MSKMFVMSTFFMFQILSPVETKAAMLLASRRRNVKPNCTAFSQRLWRSSLGGAKHFSTPTSHDLPENGSISGRENHLLPI
jgi:hypothetical protein